MKTTLEIEDSLFRSVKALAAQRGASLRRIHERALREFLQREANVNRAGFKLRDSAVDGNGLQAGVDLSNRSQMDELIFPPTVVDRE